ncbi:hypothetical protein RND81_14G063100 [Saponaria officinalis]|uniref:Uncharacterized protein n=1 Tax=Saponaria officinalis TaxID=3572 RepID=A0AAW1GMI1_SAPOF
MEATLRTMSFSSTPQLLLIVSSIPSQQLNISAHGFKFSSKIPLNKSLVTCCSYNGASPYSADKRRISSLESLFCYDKAIPEQIIEKPVGLSVAEKEIGGQARCCDCQAKGAVLCTTCGGSGLYVDSVMECQGIIVKVRCLNCGGAGNIMCSECGGRGHL